LEIRIIVNIRGAGFANTGVLVKILAEDETDIGVINTGVLFMGYLF